MIAIAAYEFDPAAILLIENPSPQSRIDAGSRRVSRTATLEPGVYIHDGGYVDGDRDARIVIDFATQAEVEAARRLVTLHNEVRVSLEDGSFLGAPESWEYRDGKLTLNILLKSKLSA